MAQQRPISVVSADDILGTNETELEAFIQSLLAAEEIPLPPPSIAPPEPAVKRTPDRPASSIAVPEKKQKRPYRCGACGAVLAGHQCVAFRPHEGRKRRNSAPKRVSRTAEAQVSTDSLLASMGTPEGKYDVHRLDAHKLRRLTELLNIWRTRRREPDQSTQLDVKSPPSVQS